MVYYDVPTKMIYYVNISHASRQLFFSQKYTRGFDESRIDKRNHTKE